MGYKGQIFVNGEEFGEASAFTIVNSELIEIYLNKFEKRGLKHKKWLVELKRVIKDTSDNDELYKKEVAKLGKPPIEEYVVNEEGADITLYLSKKETEELINALSDMLSELDERTRNDITDSNIDYIKRVTKALKKAVKSKSKIKFHLYNG